MSSNTLAIVALASMGLYVLVAFVARSLLQRRRTGSTGWRGIHGRVGSASWWAGVLLLLSLLGLVAAPVAAWLGPAHPVASLQPALGMVAFGLGLGLTVWSQLAMGDAWRIGVQPGERTELRTEGPFGWCRNPIFTGMLIAAAGVALWFPWALAAWLALWLGLELQVRAVEEPHLRATHGESYRRYAARTGRFLPGLGRMPREA